MRARRADVGLPHGDDAPLLLHEDGEPVTADAGAAAPAAGTARRG